MRRSRLDRGLGELVEMVRDRMRIVAGVRIVRLGVLPVVAMPAVTVLVREQSVRVDVSAYRGDDVVVPGQVQGNEDRLENVREADDPRDDRRSCSASRSGSLRHGPGWTASPGVRSLASPPAKGKPGSSPAPAVAGIEGSRETGSAMRVRFTKLDDRRHGLEVEVDGRVQRAELETRSTLFHDLTHLAVEVCAGVDDGFFAALARGATLGDMTRRAREGDGVVLMEVERIVALLQGPARTDEDPHALFARIEASFGLQDEAPPAWFTPDLVIAVRARLRELVGRWRATPYGATMEVSFPPPAGPPTDSEGHRVTRPAARRNRPRT